MLDLDERQILLIIGRAQSRRSPETTGNFQRIKDAIASPPGAFVSRAVQRIMMAAAQGNSELVRDFERH